MVADSRDERHESDSLEQEQNYLSSADQFGHEELSQPSAAQVPEHSQLGPRAAALVCTLCQ